MKPESILHADILDIIFENRNKEYGAYELRSHYKERLVRSMLFVLFFLITICGLSIWLLPKWNHRVIRIPFDPPVKISSVEIPKNQIIPPSAHPIATRIASVVNVSPTIVREIANVKPTPTVDELDQNRIAAIDVMGNKDDGIPGPSANIGQPGKNDAPPATEKEELVLRVAEHMPEFPGGMEALKRFLSKNLHVPKDNLETGEKVKVVVKFVVDKEGIVSDLFVTEHGGNDFDEEVLRVMKKMPHWKPGMQNGRNVAVYYYLPVTFQGPDEN